MRASKHAFVALLLTVALVFTGGCYKQRLGEQNAHGLMDDIYPVAPEKHADKLRILIWPDTLTDSVLKDFQKRYGIKLEITTFSDNDDAYDKLRANPEKWDVVMLSQYMAHRLRAEKLLQKVPKDNPYIYSYINTAVINAEDDPQMDYFVPFDYSAMGIIFNINYVAGFPKSWGFLTDSVDNPYIYGRIILPDDMRYAFAAAMLYMGIDPARATHADVEKAKRMLIANVKLLGLRFVPFPNLERELTSNDAIMAVTWSGTAGYILREKQECRFLIPEGKCIMSVDGFCIPATSKCPETAALFVEFMLHPYESWVVANDCMYASVNIRSMKYVDRFILNGPSCMTPVSEDIMHMKYLNDTELDFYEKAWSEVKAAQIDREKIRIIPVN